MATLEDLEGLVDATYLDSIRHGEADPGELELYASSKLHNWNTEVKTVNADYKVVSTFIYSGEEPDKVVQLARSGSIFAVKLLNKVVDMVSSAPTTGNRLPSSSPTGSRAAGQSTALISAYLLKQSAGKWKRKRWNQRWFVLDRDSGLLRYFRHASPLETVPLRQDAHGVVSLKHGGVSLVVQGDLPSGVPTPFCFTVLVEGQRELRLCADTNAEFRQWTATISAIISPMRAGLRVTEAKVAPTSAVSPTPSTSSAVEVPSPLQSPVAETKEKEVETVGERKEVEPRQMVEQCPMCRSASIKDGSMSPTSSTGSASGSEIAREKSSTKSRTQSATSRDQASTSSVDEPQPKRAAFLGESNGVKISAGASLRMCAPASVEIVSGSWTQIDATRKPGSIHRELPSSVLPTFQSPLGEKQGDGPGFNFITYFAIPPAIREMLDAPGEPSLQAVRVPRMTYSRALEGLEKYFNDVMAKVTQLESQYPNGVCDRNGVKIPTLCKPNDRS
ncbi:PH domain-like [Phytophthora cactorum]|nr:PH domain-like [Phytophthora cactorum]